MSKKTEEAKRQEQAAWKRVLRLRRAALAVLLLFSGLCLVGSQGPWYQTHVRDQPVGEPVWGADFRWVTTTTDFDRSLAALEGGVAAVGTETVQVDLDLDQDPPTPGFWERPGFLAHAVLWSCLAVLFFAGFNLANSATLDWPLLIACLLVAAAVGATFHALSVAPSTLRRVIEEVTRAGALAPGVGDDASGVAAVGSATPGVEGLLNTVSMRFGWGAALMGASAPLLVPVSVLLTLFLKRKP
ncbi:MAG: hypothetical protein R3F62_06650 [Planctomycetota bacterium]